MSIQLARVNTALKQPVGTPWPETFTPGQIAWLLTWTNDNTKYKEWSRDCRLWEAMIKDACERGELDHTTATKTIQISEARVVEDGRISLGALGGRFASPRQGYVEPAKTEEITTRHITAQNAARWLEVQQHPPGEMLQAWFKVRGVAAGAQVLELVQPASATPATWTELLTYHRANEGHEWTPELKTIIAREHARRQGEKGLAKAMANELGLTVSRLNELIRKKDESSIRKVIANRRTGT